MQIKSVRIKNFRNFSDFSIDFSDGFQLLIGENNIGKSNFYWALRLALDKNIPYTYKKLKLTDFFGRKNSVTIDDYVLISIELYAKDLAKFPVLHSIKTGNDTARITFVFAHKNRFDDYIRPATQVSDGIAEEVKPSIDDFKFKYLCGDIDSNHFEFFKKAERLEYSDLDLVNMYYIDGFRKINSDIQGGEKSLLSKYFKSRKSAANELAQMQSILNVASEQLNALKIIDEASTEISASGSEITSNYFGLPISIGFESFTDDDVLGPLCLTYSNAKDGNVNFPINTLGLGQKNILFLSIFLAALNNSANPNEFNILLIEEPEAHLHPQLQKVLFSKLSKRENTQVFMTSHSPHIASDCSYKNINVIYRSAANHIKSFAPFKKSLLNLREINLLQRYLDATRSELFFASGIVLVEGVGEQFIVPTISKMVYSFDLSEYNISVIPIHSRYFDPYLKLFQDESLEIPCIAIIDGDQKEVIAEGEETTAIANARKLEVNGRVTVFAGNETLEIDLFPDSSTNSAYLKLAFENLGHAKSHANLMEIANTNPERWNGELISRIDGTIKKGRFAQELAGLIKADFIVPKYLSDAIATLKQIKASSNAAK